MISYDLICHPKPMSETFCSGTNCKPRGYWALAARWYKPHLWTPPCFAECWCIFILSLPSKSIHEVQKVFYSFHWPDCRMNQLAPYSYNSTFMGTRKCVGWMFVWLNYHWKPKIQARCRVVCANSIHLHLVLLFDLRSWFYHQCLYFQVVNQG